MSVRIKAKIICDGCGAEMWGRESSSSTYAVENYADAKEQAKNCGWVTLLGYGPSRHYFRACADKPQPKKALTKST